MYSEIEIAKLCDALSAYKRKKAKTKIKQLIDIGKMHETVVGVAVTAGVLMAYTNRVVKKVYNKSLRMTKNVSGKREREYGKELCQKCCVIKQRSRTNHIHV